MKVLTRIHDIRNFVLRAKKRNKKVGFVPTMGAFHEGHLSLIRRCKKECGLCVVSIFVNPIQFGPGEDFESYPRPKKSDCLLAKNENVDIIFYPSEKTMYPTRYLTFISVGELTRVLCGKSRPGHFDGVATVVAKLLNIVEPDVMYLGQKDAQQCRVLQQMVNDLNLPVELKVCPIIRESNGLAMSSRNKYLLPRQRREAAVIYESLRLARARIQKGERKASSVKQMIFRQLKKTSAKIDYVACVDQQTLKNKSRLQGHVLIAIAAKFGKTRLIDNIRLHIK